MNFSFFYILSGRIGKVVASRAEVSRLIPAKAALIYTMHEALKGLCPRGWWVRPVNWIYRLRLHCPLLVVDDCNYRSSSLRYFSRLLQVVDNY